MGQRSYLPAPPGADPLSSEAHSVLWSGRFPQQCICPQRLGQTGLVTEPSPALSPPGVTLPHGSLSS